MRAVNLGCAISNHWMVPMPKTPTGAVADTTRHHPKTIRIRATSKTRLLSFYTDGPSVGTPTEHETVLDDFPEEASVKLEKALEAVKRIKAQFEDWLTIGHAVVDVRSYANRVGGRQTFMKTLRGCGIMQSLDKGTVSRLERIMNSLDEVKSWRHTLTQQQRLAWSSPRSIVSRCPAFRPARPQEPKPSPLTKMKEELAASLQREHDLTIRLSKADGDQKIARKLQRLNDLLNETLEWAAMPPDLRERIERELGDDDDGNS
jgi:hypothetical protein